MYLKNAKQILLLTLYFFHWSCEAQWDFSGTYALRYEYIQNAPRINASTTDSLLGSRFELVSSYTADKSYWTLELQDARVFLDDANSPLGTDDVNTLEPIQAYWGYRWGTSQENDVKLGRFTLDLGNRRLLARPRFRNTRNSFTGGYVRWMTDSTKIESLVAMPDNRFPRNFVDLDANKAQLDKNYAENLVWSIYLTLDLTNKDLYELYYFGLKESDQDDLNTRNRRLHTFGGRLVKSFLSGFLHLESEGAYQLGRARASSKPEDVTDLDVNAWFGYITLGHKFDDIWSSKIDVELNYASGDKDKEDDKFQQFDPLFGVRRAEFNATNLYGFFGRKNHKSVGVLFRAKPSSESSLSMSYRALWLATADDRLPSLNLSNSSNEDFLGYQLEGRFRYQFNPTVMLETGGIYLAKGEFFDNTDQRVNSENTVYLYSEMSLKF